MSLYVDEHKIPVCEAVRGACELLGYDPLYVANEGRFLAMIPKRDAEVALEVLNSVEPSSSPVIIGSVLDAGAGLVTMRTLIGSERNIEMLSGEQLPRIC